MTSVDASHDETPGDDHAPGEVTDEMVLAVIDEFVAENGKTPGRNKLAARAGIGASRAQRFLREHADRTAGPDRSTRPDLRPVRDAGPSTHPDRSELPDQTGPSYRSERSEQPDRLDQATGPTPGPDRPGQPVQASDLHESSHPDRTGPDRTERSEYPDRPGPSDRSEHASGPVRVSGPTVDPDRSERSEPGAWAEAGSAVGRFVAGWARKATPAEAGERTDPVRAEPAPTRELGKVAQAFVSARAMVIPVTVVVGFIGAGIVTWTGGVLLAQRLGWGPVAVAPGWAEGIKVDPTLFLPLCVELVLAVAVHRISAARPGPGRKTAVMLGIVALAIAVLVQFHAHADTLPGWLGPFIGVVPVIALAMLVALSNIPTKQT